MKNLDVLSLLLRPGAGSVIERPVITTRDFVADPGSPSRWGPHSYLVWAPPGVAVKPVQTLYGGPDYCLGTVHVDRSTNPYCEGYGFSTETWGPSFRTLTQAALSLVAEAKHRGRIA